MSRLDGWTMVFDLDGTLVDTAPDLHAALNHCLQEAGYGAVPFPAIGDMIGQGAKAMIRKGLAYQDQAISEEALEPVWNAFLHYYRDNISVFSRPFPGMLETMATLSEAGARLAVCTNKTQALAEELIESLNLSSHFSAIRGADAVPNKKPDGDHIARTVQAAGGVMARAAMIGDSQTDERAARNAGLPFVFVSFGYGPVPERHSEMLWADTFADVTAHLLALGKA